MAKAGLSFANPMLGAMDVNIPSTPMEIMEANKDFGLQSLGPTMADAAVYGRALTENARFTLPDMDSPQAPQGPQVKYSPSTKKMFVNGALFDVENATAALESEQYLGTEPKAAPTDVANDWMTLSPQDYGAYIKTIKDPSIGRLMSKNWDIGVSNLKLLGGRGLQFLGFEETGQGIVDRAAKELEYNEPYQREFTNIDSVEGGVDWFVANLMQQGPNLLESIAVALAGFFAGTTQTGSPLVGGGTALAALAGKAEFKRQVLAAARKRMAGEALNQAEKRVLQSAAAMSAVAANSYAMGVSDIYGELRDTGSDAGDVSSRLTALLGGIPYAALESIPEFMIGKRLLGGKMIGGAKGGALRRGMTGLGVAGTAEGLTEAGQEGLLMGAGAIENQYDYSDEALNRLVNSFAAGFAVGGPMGGVANLRKGKESNLLDSGSGPKLSDSREVGPYTGPREGELLGPEMPPAAPTPPLLSAPVPDVAVGEQPNYVVGPDGTTRPATALDTPVTINAPTVPGQAAGQQGVLNVFGGQPMTAEELATRLNPQLAVSEQLSGEPAQQEVVGPQQPSPQMELPLDFQGANVQSQVAQTQAQGQPINAMQAAMLAATEKRAQAAEKAAQEAEAARARAEQERQAEREKSQLLERQYREMELSMAEQDRREAAARPLVQQQELPTVPAQPTPPKQLDLFRGQVKLPRMSKAQQAAQRKALRQQERDAQAAQTAAEQAALPLSARVTPAEAYREAGQLPLFTQRGEPSVAALRSAAPTTPVAAPVVEEGATQAPPTGRQVNALTAAVARAEAAAKAAEEATKKAEEAANAVQERSTAQVDVREQPQAGTEVRGRDTTEQPVTTAKGQTLRRGKAPQGAGTVRQEEAAATVREAGDRQDNVRTDQEKVDQQVDTGFATPVEAWEEMVDVLPNGRPVVEFDNLPDAAKAEWEAIYKRGEVNGYAAENLMSKYEDDMNAVDRLHQAIATAESTSDMNEFENAILTVIELAFINTDSNNAKTLSTFGYSVRERAEAFMNNTTFTGAQWEIIDDAFVGEVNAFGKIEGAYKSGANKGQAKAWMNFAAQRGLLDSIKATITNPPKWYTDTLAATKGERIGTTEQEAAKETLTSAEQKNAAKLAAESIADRIKRIATGVDVIRNKANSKFVKAIEALYETADKNYMTDRGKIGEYFDKDGKLRLRKRVDTGTFTPVNKELTAEQLKQLEADERAAMQARKDAEKAEAEAEAEAVKRLKRGQKETVVQEDTFDDTVYDDEYQDIIDSFDNSTDSNEGMFYRDDGSVINTTVGIGKVKLLAKQFLAKLKVKPNLTVVRNMAELAAKYPELYARAAKSVKNFEAMAGRAVGFSVGDQVIVFADRVRTEDQLKFVLAHEALGHFGLKSILSPAQLKAVLNDIYNSDPFVRARVDRMMATEGMSQMEATEEVLADMAGAIDASTIVKIWNFIKSALNKLGMKFGDEMARYWVGQARRNIRTGHGVVSAQVLARNLDRLAKETKFGRFSLEQDSARLASSAFAANAFNNNSFGVRGFKAFFERIADADFTSIRGGINDVVSALSETVQTLDNMATRSEGLQKVFEIFQKQAARTKRFLTKYEGLTTFSHTPSWTGGPTQEELQQAGELLAYAALLKRGQLTDKMMKDMGDLFTIDQYGNPQPNPAVVQRVMDAGKVNRQEFEKGFTVTNSLGEEIQYKPEFEITDRIWKVFEEQRNAVNQSALDVLEANFYAAHERKQAAVEGFKDFTGTGGAFTDVDIQVLQRILKEYGDLYTENSVDQGGSIKMNPESMKKANRFLAAINRALWNKEKVKDWQGGTDTAAEFQDEKYKDIISALERLNGIGLSENKAYEVTNTIANMFMMDSQIQSAQFYAKRTIMGAYVPFVRRGKYQVVMKAYDKDGKAVRLNGAYQSSMPYFQDDSRSGADSLVSELDEAFGGDREFVVLNSDNEEVTVTFRAERSRTLETAQVSNSVDFNEFINTVNRLKISITPQERHTIVENLTNINSRARKNLERSGSPGWDKDVIRATSEFLETQGHVAGKAFYRHKLNDIMVDKNLWRGNPEKLRRLKKAYEDAKKGGNEAQIKQAKTEYDRYAYMYMHMADAGQGKTVEINGKKEPTLGRGNVYLDQANRLLDWYSDSGNIVDSTEDLLSSGIGSKLKMWAVVMQLGGSVATAAINLVSLVTHTIPYLSTYNPKRGFGGGFGASKTAANVYRAAANLKNPKLSDVKHLDEVVASKELQQKYGLSQAEAQFLRDATAEGVLQAAQFNALVGTARGGVRNNNTAGFIQAWMSMFSYTEQMNRRVTALAAYRMERERSLAAGLSEQAALERAAEEAYKAVNKSQGEYAMYNRPEMARGNVLQYIFMYKQFVIISVQLMKGLSPKGRVMFLGMLFLMSGMKGIPFADDIMDLIDTLAQMFGIKMGSFEKEIAGFVDEIAPGMSPVVMRGLMDRYTGMTVSTRLGFGDLIPLSGAFRAGADPARELENFAGPVWSGMAGLVGLGTQLGRYGAEAIGLREDVTSLSSIMRNQPIAAVRNMADGLTYLNDGSITNAQGKLVSPEVSNVVALGRMFGFYPAVATRDNDVVRMSKFAGDHANAIRKEFTDAYVKAAVSNDSEEMMRVKMLVKEWNMDNRGTPYEYRTWFQTAPRAAREAKKPTLLRYKKSAPTSMRKEIDDLMRIYGVEY